MHVMLAKQLFLVKLKQNVVAVRLEEQFVAD